MATFRTIISQVLGILACMDKPKPLTLDKFDAFESPRRDFFEKLRDIKRPFAHGTTSDHLASIIARGIGAEIPQNAFEKDGSIWLTDLSQKGGISGAHGFAMLNPEALEIRGEQFPMRNQGDAIDRFASQNRKSDLSVLEQSRSLHRQFELYKVQRGFPQGFPTLLIYEGVAVDPTSYEYANPNYDCEVKFAQKPENMPLKMLLVPEQKISEVRLMLRSHHGRYDVEIFPIEVMELKGSEEFVKSS